jgi:hypothetical protein
MFPKGNVRQECVLSILYAHLQVVRVDGQRNKKKTAPWDRPYLVQPNCLLTASLRFLRIFG